MKRNLFLALVLSIALPPTALASDNPAHTLEILGQASGGTHWKNIAAIVADGSESIDGLRCHVHSITDTRNGHWLETVHCPVFDTAQGIDSKGAWKRDRSGQVHSLDSPEARTLTVTDRWLNRNGPYFPGRLHAALAPAPTTTVNKTTYQRIKAAPADGRSVTLWIGGTPKRLARTVMLRSFQTVTTMYSDYRNVVGVTLPFRIASSVDVHAKPDVETITHYRLLRSIPKQALERPSDRVTDVKIPAKGVRMPFDFSPGGKLLVEARINGKGPFPFVLDTGGHAILTPETAKTLGLKTSGGGVSYGAGAGSTPLSYARVKSIGLGDARIDDQSVLIMPLSPIMTDLGNKPPVAGILGLEVFERFAVTIDPAHKTLTLQPFANFKPPAGAVVLPIGFTDDMPLVNATLDGKRGIFGMDTGNSGPLMIFPKWTDDNGLASYYQAGLPEQNGGEGGVFTTHMAYIHSLQIGGLMVPGKQLGMLTPPGAGSTSNPSEAGNLGLPVWRAFRFALDYRTEQLYLTPRPHYTPRQPTASGGFSALKFQPKAFTVIQVAPGGPAAKAGLKKGDQIVAVDGTKAENLASLYIMSHIAKSKPGTHLKLTCSDGRTLTVMLVPNTAMQKALHPTANEQK